MLIAQATTTSPSTATWIGAGVGLIVWIGIIIWTVSIATKKGRSGLGWGAFAFFFSLLALLVVAVVPSRRTS